jgi:hypothetical protein
MRLVDNWKKSAKFATNWFHGAQLAVAGAWAVLPADLKTYLPPKVMIGVAAFLGVGGIIARMIDQSGDNPNDPSP